MRVALYVTVAKVDILSLKFYNIILVWFYVKLINREKETHDLERERERENLPD